MKAEFFGMDKLYCKEINIYGIKNKFAKIRLKRKSKILFSRCYLHFRREFFSTDRSVTKEDLTPHSKQLPLSKMTFPFSLCPCRNLLLSLFVPLSLLLPVLLSMYLSFLLFISRPSVICF